MNNTLNSNDEIRFRTFLDMAAADLVSSVFAMPSQVVTAVPGTSHDKQHLLWDD